MEGMPDWTLAYIPCLGYLMFNFDTGKFYWEQTTRNRMEKDYEQRSREVFR